MKKINEQTQRIATTVFSLKWLIEFSANWRFEILSASLVGLWWISLEAVCVVSEGLGKKGSKEDLVQKLIVFQQDVKPILGYTFWVR